MKRKLLICLVTIVLAHPIYADDRYTCSVTHHASGEGSLRELLRQSEEGVRCRDNITFDELALPSRIILEEPIQFQGQGVLITGAHLSSENEESLGIVIDARGVTGCVMTFCYPQLNVLEHLTFYVSDDFQKVLCNAQGQSLLHPSSPAYDPRYNHIRVCRGVLANQCEEAPLREATTQTPPPPPPPPRNRPQKWNPLLTEIIYSDLSHVDWTQVVKIPLEERPPTPMPPTEMPEPSEDRGGGRAGSENPPHGQAGTGGSENNEPPPPIESVPGAGDIREPTRERRRSSFNSETTTPSCHLMREE